MDCFQIRKGICEGCIQPPHLFNLWAEYIKQNARLVEAQAGINTARRNISKLRYAYDTTLMTESKEKLTRLLTKVKMSEKAGLYPTFKKMKITASDPIAS